MTARNFNQEYNYKAVREDRYLDQIIIERGLTGNLNNTKWVKLIDIMVTHHSLIKECQVKLIWEEEYTGRMLLINEDIDYRLDYYDQAMEAMITGGPSGWYAYREIEWLSFPRYPTSQPGEQNLEVIKVVLDSIGQIPFVLTNDVLQLDAYRGIAS